ncbi:hypothetical protein [Streptomyces altiplanensis]
MTRCPKGGHEIPNEDEIGAHCDEHGVTLLWHGPPITPEDLAPEHHAPSTARPAAPAHRALGPHPR